MSELKRKESFEEVELVRIKAVTDEKHKYLKVLNDTQNFILVSEDEADLFRKDKDGESLRQLAQLSFDLKFGFEPAISSSNKKRRF